MNKFLKFLFSAFTIVLALTLVNCNNDDDFTEVSVTAVNPTSVYPLESVTIQGSNFDYVQFVFVGDKHTEFFLNEDGTLTFVVPENAQVGNNVVTLAMVNDYRVHFNIEVLLTPVPIIQNFDAFVAVGSNVTITGTSFNAGYNPVVTIDDVPATIVSNTDTELVVTVPAGVDDNAFLDLTVSNDFGEATASTAFVARQNFLVNSTLSEGSGDEFTGWEKLNGGETMTELTGNDAYGGGRSMRVAPAGGNPWDRQFASTPTPLTFGEQYTIILFAKAESAGAQMRVSVSQWDGNGADYFYGDTVEISNADWLPYTWTFTVTNDLPTHKVVLDMGMGSVPFGIDHIALVPGAFSAVAGPPELLSNGSFEDGLTGWESLNGAHDISTSEAYCGDQSLTATGAGGNPWDSQLASDPMDLVVGTQYEIGFWAKAAGPDGVFRISMSQWDGNGSDFFYSDDLSIPEDWKYFSFVVEAASVPSGVYRLLFDMGATSQTFFVDAVTVKEYEVVGSSLAANGGFEDGLTNWNTLNGAHEVSTTESHSGSASMTATGAGGNPWDVQMASDPMDMEEGNDYKISFWAKAAGPDGVFRISMSQWDGNGSDFFYSDDLSIPEDWTYYSFVVNAAAVPSGEYRLLFDMGASTQTFFVDDVSVVPYDACD
ncbi:carbohydrate binding domain-containing protein [Mangrovimonas xylaniphaga]|uniref:carbohydrate binding domain-containing protein n=1 Tax=Mangrovimonas xylaniphaga TaxID=1645915 RepID=UPI0009EC55BE|nr:carbohydrate binding domain-containing protein [Mangrovimonas xylaniphaga]